MMMWTVEPWVVTRLEAHANAARVFLRRQNPITTWLFPALRVLVDRHELPKKVADAISGINQMDSAK